MNGFQHLPEYSSAAQSYRMERTRIERAPRRTGDRASLLRRIRAALTTRPTSIVRVAR